MSDDTTSTYDQTEYSRDLSISASGHDNINELQDLPGSPFADTDMKDIYVLATAYGYRKDRLADADATGSVALVQRKTLSEEQEAVMEAIAIAHEDSPMVLKDQKRIAAIAQRYALGGLEALIEHCQDADSPREEFISEISAAR